MDCCHPQPGEPTASHNHNHAGLAGGQAPGMSHGSAAVFAPWGFFLRPEVGALLMSLSTVIVVLNALWLKRLDLQAV